MRSTPLRRRLTYGVLSGGLVAGVLVPLSASAASCASWADDAGDATTRQSGIGVLGDANLDIVGAALGTVGKDLVGTITTDGLSGSSSDAGDEFRFRFTIAENDVIFYVDRVAPFGEEVDVTAGFYNFTTDESGDATAEFDVENKTVRLTGALSELEAAVGAPVARKPLTDVVAQTLNQVLGATPARYDDAPTPLKPVVGTACSFPKGAPKPAASPAASASASPAASPSASPPASPQPSGSPSPQPSGSASPEPSGSPSPQGPPPPPEPTVPVPAPGCVGFADEAADATSAAGPATFGNDPDLDIVSVTGRTTEDTISGHLGITKLGRPKAPISGHRFEYEFTAGGKKIVLRASGPGVATGLVDGSATADLSVSAVFDEVSSQVVLTVDRTSLVKVLGVPLPDGAVLTKTAGRSYAQTAVTTSLADTASPEDPRKAMYVVGDNECFRPKMSVTAPAQVQTSDVAFVNVALVTSDGRVAREQTVIGRVGTGRAVTAVTDAQGTATLTVPVTDAAGVTELVVRSSGDAGEGELRTTLRVLVERTLLSLSRSGSGDTRTIAATLTDDDEPRRRLVGQKVTFFFGGRSVGATTDRRGRAVATVPAGSTVDVVFAGRTGFLSSAKVRTTA